MFTKEYFKSYITYAPIPGSHDSGKEIRGKLGYYMKQLKESNHNDEIVEDLLNKIYSELDLDYEYDVFHKQYLQYLHILSDRSTHIEKYNQNKCFNYFKLKPIENLSKDKWNLWGSYKQFMSGQYIVDAMKEIYGYNLHPVWGALMNPTGGMIGPANLEIVSGHWQSGLGLHACCHDSCGYLYLYHKWGKGYNYLNTWKTAFPTWSSLSCQLAGISYWNKLCKNY